MLSFLILSFDTWQAPEDKQRNQKNEEKKNVEWAMGNMQWMAEKEAHTKHIRAESETDKSAGKFAKIKICKYVQQIIPCASDTSTHTHTDYTRTYNISILHAALCFVSLFYAPHTECNNLIK